MWNPNIGGFPRYRKSRICKTKLATGCPCDSKHHEGSWQERVEHNLVLFIPLALRFEWTRSRKLAETSCIAMIKLYREALWGWNFPRGKAVAKWRAESLAFQTVPSETSDCFPRGTGALRRPSKLADTAVVKARITRDRSGGLLHYWRREFRVRTAYRFYQSWAWCLEVPA